MSGCGCENTEFGCCLDERTPARGPDKSGCGCEASKYGCCPDGETEAQGEKFEGCTEVPAIPGGELLVHIVHMRCYQDACTGRDSDSSCNSCVI